MHWRRNEIEIICTRDHVESVAYCLLEGIAGGVERCPLGDFSLVFASRRAQDILSHVLNLVG